jgi:hypothetical protein
VSARRHLPNRRSHELVNFEFRGAPYVVGVGRFPDGSLSEVFIDAVDTTAKGMLPLNEDAKDAAVCLSLALQFGCPSETIRQAVTRTSAGEPVGIVGRVLDILSGGRE